MDFGYTSLASPPSSTIMINTLQLMLHHQHHIESGWPGNMQELLHILRRSFAPSAVRCDAKALEMCCCICCAAVWFRVVARSRLSSIQRFDNFGLLNARYAASAASAESRDYVWVAFVLSCATHGTSRNTRFANIMASHVVLSTLIPIRVISCDAICEHIRCSRCCFWHNNYIMRTLPPHYRTISFHLAHNMRAYYHNMSRLRDMCLCSRSAVESTISVRCGCCCCLQSIYALG